jgi:hypothetical protein
VTTDPSSRHTVPAELADLAGRVEALLPQDAVIRHIIGGQRFSPLINMTPLALLWTPFMQWRLAAVADDAIYIMKATFWDSWQASALLRTLPRNTKLYEGGRAWPRARFGSERVWVLAPFRPELEAADRELTGIDDEETRAVPRTPIRRPRG